MTRGRGVGSPWASPWLSPWVRAQAGDFGEPWQVPSWVVTISGCLWLGPHWGDGAGLAWGEGSALPCGSAQLRGLAHQPALVLVFLRDHGFTGLRFPAVGK